MIKINQHFTGNLTGRPHHRFRITKQDFTNTEKDFRSLRDDTEQYPWIARLSAQMWGSDRRAGTPIAPRKPDVYYGQSHQSNPG